MKRPSGPSNSLKCHRQHSKARRMHPWHSLAATRCQCHHQPTPWTLLSKETALRQSCPDPTISVLNLCLYTQMLQVDPFALCDVKTELTLRIGSWNVSSACHKCSTFQWADLVLSPNSITEQAASSCIHPAKVENESAQSALQVSNLTATLIQDPTAALQPVPSRMGGPACIHPALKPRSQGEKCPSASKAIHCYSYSIHLNTIHVSEESLMISVWLMGDILFRQDDLNHSFGSLQPPEQFILIFSDFLHSNWYSGYRSSRFRPTAFTLAKRSRFPINHNNAILPNPIPISCT